MKTRVWNNVLLGGGWLLAIAVFWWVIRPVILLDRVDRRDAFSEAAGQGNR